MTTKVLICEDDGLFREMLHTSLANQPSMEVVGSVADGASVIKMARELKPQVVLVDIELQSEPNGIEAGQLIKEEDPSVGVVILSMHRDKDYLSTIPIDRVAGWSYLWKQSVNDVATLTRAVEGTAAGLTIMDPSVVRALRPKGSSIISTLSARQLEVLELLAQGYSNKRIAQELFLGEKSVENYVKVVYEKLHITREGSLNPRVQAVVLYLENTQSS